MKQLSKNYAFSKPLISSIHPGCHFVAFLYENKSWVFKKRSLTLNIKMIFIQHTQVLIIYM